MRETFQTALAVIQWRQRSLWALGIGLIISIIVSTMLIAQLENYAATSTSMSNMMLPTLTILYKFILVLVFFAPFIFSGLLFLKDWKAFHRIW